MIADMFEYSDIYEAMDDSLESWCLLMLQPRDETGEAVTGWHLGFENSANLVRVDYREQRWSVEDDGSDSIKNPSRS